jgi:hypothetical protein
MADVRDVSVFPISQPININLSFYSICSLFAQYGLRSIK